MSVTAFPVLARILTDRQLHKTRTAALALACAAVDDGTFIAASLTGSDRREAAALGILMNTRGLMELIVLNVGLELGVLSPTLFTMFVHMAVVTTLARTPILQALTPNATT